MPTEDGHSHPQGPAGRCMGRIWIQADHHGCGRSRTVRTGTRSSVIGTSAVSDREGVRPQVCVFRASDDARWGPGSSTRLSMMPGGVTGRQDRSLDRSYRSDDVVSVDGSRVDRAVSTAVELYGRRASCHDRTETVTHWVSRTHRKLTKSRRTAQGLVCVPGGRAHLTKSRPMFFLPARCCSAPRIR